MARPKKIDKDAVISVKVPEQQKESLSMLAELQGLEFSVYLRQVLKEIADQQSDLIKKALAEKRKYNAKISKLANNVIPIKESVGNALKTFNPRAGLEGVENDEENKES